jgi:GT2 family glycosyltransferase
MIGILVITHNSGEVVGACVDSCLRVPDSEVLVIDNASADDTLDVVSVREGVRVIANRQNHGFAGAANQGIRALRHPQVLLVNPDAILQTPVDPLVRAVNRDGVGAAAGQLVDRKGGPQQGFNVRGFPTPLTLAYEVLGLNRIFPRNRVNAKYRPVLQAEGWQEVDQPAGAFMLVRREAWEAVGGFDEEFYPIWFEDVDFCRRLKLSGYKILYVPETCARHEGAHSARALPWWTRQLYWYDSLLRYASKHFSVAARRALCITVMLGFLPRTIARAVLCTSLGPFTVYSRVIHLAGSYLRGRVAHGGGSACDRSMGRGYQ